MKSCANCHFYNEKTAAYGACRRRAPQIIQTDTRPSHDGAAVPVYEAAQPMVSHSDWCGEFEERKGTMQ